MHCVLKKPFMLYGCIGFPNEVFPPPDLCSPKHGAGLRERFCAAVYAVCRRRFAARRRGFAERKDVLTVCRGFRGLRKIFLRALAPARPVRRAPFPIRSATGTSRIRRGARARKDVFVGHGAAGKSQKKDSPLVTGGFCRRAQRRFCARFGRLRLLAGKHVCVPTALSAADAGSRQKETFRPCGAAAGG